MYTFIDNLNKEEFDAYAKSAPYSSLLQSYSWAKVKNNFTPFYVGVKQDEQLVATALVLIRNLGFGQKLAYIPRGPLCDFSNTELLKFFTQNLKVLGKKQKCLFLRIDPAIPYRHYLIDDLKNAQPDPNAERIIDQLISIGYQHNGLTKAMSDSFQPRVVSVVKLDENTTKNYKNKLKKSLKYTQKRLTTVDHGQYEYLDHLQDMIEHTEARQEVSLRDKAYFKKILDTYPESSKITIAKLQPKKYLGIFNDEIQKRMDEIELIKERSPKKVFHLNEQIESYQSLINELETIKDQDEIVIGALLSVTYGETINLLYAGTDITFGKFFPQELIYHTLIEESVKEGLKNVDMGGIQGSLDDGLTIFKSQFNPEIHEYIGEFDLILSPKTKLFNLAWKIRKYLKNKRHSA